MANIRVHFDGSCLRGRGGPIGGWGFTIEGEGLDFEACGRLAEPFTTNNVAEYIAAIKALEYLVSHGYRGSVEVIGDSQLVIRQFSGEYSVKAPHLKLLYTRLKVLTGSFEGANFLWVPREENRRADALSKSGARCAPPSQSSSHVPFQSSSGGT